MPVRFGTPTRTKAVNELVSPMYATSVGLVKYGAEHFFESAFSRNDNPENTFSNVLGSLKDVVRNFF